MRGLSEDLIEYVSRWGYYGIPMLLILGGLGLPIPEEAPIILAAVMTREQAMWGPFAFASCMVGVLAGDFVVYGLGYVYGERVLEFPVIRSFLTKARETQIKGYFHRHGFKILILGRFAVGFRTAAYLTAGILRLPALNLLLTDLVAATLSTSLMFGLGYLFADQIKILIAEAQHWLAGILAAAITIALLARYYRGRKRAGKPIGLPAPPTGNLTPPPVPPALGPASLVAPPSSPSPLDSSTSQSPTTPPPSTTSPLPMDQSPELAPSSNLPPQPLEQPPQNPPTPTSTSTPKALEPVASSLANP